MDFQETLEQNFHKVYEPLKKVLEHYSCPDECGSHCCRTCRIEFGKLEYKIISDRHVKARKVLRSKAKRIQSELYVNGVTLIGYEFTEHPCPLLNKSNKCSIQDVKPISCAIYPFALCKNSDGSLIALEPCPMGVNVISDYILFRCLSVYYSDLTDKEKEEIIGGDLELFKNSVESQDAIWTSGNVIDLFVQMPSIEFFAQFLEACPECDRIDDRKEFGIEKIRTDQVNKFLNRKS